MPPKAKLDIKSRYHPEDKHEDADYTKVEKPETEPKTGPKVFQYHSLNTEIDCIRLVKLLPSANKFDPIQCELQYVAFREKPKFDALSYTWGSQTERKYISLDGAPFAVGLSLYRALKRLRPLEDEDPKIIWIDAICIDQEDVEEKNQQIPFMPFIYGRAQQVLVWLDGPDEPMAAAQSWHNVSDSARQQSSPLDRDRLLSVCLHSYWTRVWIIQEIAKARKILIYWKFFSFPFSHLIERMNYELGSESNLGSPYTPQILAKQRDDRFGKSHLLQSLMITHQNAQCQEPQDHIYGFLGLATNIDGKITVDYRKPLWEVYTDVIKFLHSDSEAVKERHKIIEYAKALGKLLGGPAALAPIPSPEDPSIYISETNRDNLGETIFSVPAKVLGQIQDLGSSYESLMGSMSKVDAWRSTVAKSTQQSQTKSSLEQNESFLQSLEDFQEESSKVVFAFDRSIMWIAKNPRLTVLKNAASLFQSRSLPPVIATPDDNIDAESSERRICLIRTIQPETDISTIGLAPPGAKEGDWVAQIDGIAAAVIVRQRDSIVHAGKRKTVNGAMAYTLIGCAGLAVPGNEKERLSAMFVKPSIDWLGDHEKIDLFVDVYTIWQLSQGVTT